MKKNFKISQSFFTSLTISCLLGCANFAGITSSSSARVEEVAVKRETAILAKVVDLKINSSQYLDLLKGSPEKNKIRLVKIFSSGTIDQVYPEYRLFDVRDNSIYTLLGLKTADILVSAQEITFSSPQKFFGYLTIIPKQKFGKIEIRRNGLPLVFNYSFY
ncbi:MAG: hypothetical protein KDD56_06600 [Bdellovibrionales bacterium]|nr:hypothetical protein [Bdellovibrionales bacterium]